MKTMVSTGVIIFMVTVLTKWLKLMCTSILSLGTKVGTVAMYSQSRALIAVWMRWPASVKHLGSVGLVVMLNITWSSMVC